MTLPQLLERAKKIDVNKIVAAIVLNDSSEILDTIIDTQLKKGIAGDGSQIGVYKDDGYAVMKNRMNPQAGEGNIDLILEGDWVGGFKMISEGEGTFGILSTDPKDDDLSKRYGKETKELTKENEANYINKELNPQVLAALQKGLTG